MWHKLSTDDDESVADSIDWPNDTAAEVSQLARSGMAEKKNKHIRHYINA